MRVILVLFGLLVLLVGVGFGLLHTDWARDKVRGVVVDQLNKRLRGTVTIDRLDGDLLDAITLRGVELRDKEGKQVLRADSLTVDYRLLPLLDNHFHSDLIAIVGLEATLRRLPDGRLAVADLWIQQPPGGDPWTTRLADIRVERSAVKIERAPGVWDEVSRLEIEADVAVETDETRVALRSLDAEYKGPDLGEPVAVSIAAGMRIPAAGGMELSGIDVTAGHQHVLVPALHLGADGSRSGAFAIQVSAAELARVWAPSPVVGDLILAGFVRQDPDNGRALAHVFGGADRGALNLAADLSARATGGGVDLFWAGIRPEAIVRGAPPGELDGWASGLVSGLPPDFQLDRLDVGALEGRFRGAVSGALRGAEMEAVSFDAKLKERAVEAKLRAAARFGEVKADVAAVLPEDLQDTGAILIKAADVRADLRDAGELERALGQPVTTRGAVALTASARGRLSDLTVESEVKSKGISRKELRLTGVLAKVKLDHVDVQRLPGRAVGHVEAHVDSIRNGPTDYGSGHIRGTLTDGGKRAELTFNSGGVKGVGARGHLVARLDPDGGARVQFRELRVATKNLVWTGKGGRLEVSAGARRIVADLSLGSAAGSLRVSGDLRQRGGQLRGPVKFDLAGLDIGRLLAQVDRTGVTGKVDARGELTLPSGPGAIDLTATKIAWKGAPNPVGGKVRVTLADRALQASAKLEGGALGRLDIDVTGRTPALLTDGKAWGRLGPKAISSVKAKAEKVDVARWIHETGGPTTGARLRSGIASLDLQAGAGLETGKLSLAVNGGEIVAGTDLVVPATLKAEVGLTRSQVTLWTHVDAKDVGKLEVDARARVPARPLAAAGWRRQGLDLLQSLSVKVTDFDLARLQPPRTGKGVARRSLELTGMVQAQITAGPGARQLGGKITFADVRAVDLAQPLSGELSLQAAPRATDVKLAIKVPSGPIVDGAVNIGVGADRVRSLDFAALSRAMRSSPLSGQLRIPQQPVARIASAMKAKPNASGTLRGLLTVRGSIARPVVAAEIEAPGFTAEGIRFDTLRATGSYRAGPWKASVSARQSDGGRVVLEASGAPGRSAPLKVHLDAQRVKLGLLSPLWKKPGGMLTQLDGLLFANLDITGSTAQPVIDGSVRIRGGKARIAQFLRPITEIRADVVFKRSQVELTVRGKSRPGKLVLTGSGDFRRFDQASFRAKLDASRLPVQAGSQLISINGKVNAAGRSRGGMWDVGVEIERGLLVRLPSTGGVQLHDSGPLDDVVFTDAAGAAQEAAREQLKKATGPSMRLRIKSDDLVAVRSDQLRIDLRIDLTVTTINGVAVMDGNVDAVRGWIEIVSRRYNLERGRVLFAGEVPVDPRLDLRVSHQFPDTLVFIDVQGRLSEPQVTFASDNGAYDQAQLLGLILGGEGGGGGGSLSEEAPGAAANVVANQVAGLIRQAGLPVDALRVGQEEGDQASRYVTIGKWLTDRLFVAYKYRDTTDTLKNRNEATFQHFFTTNWMWEGTAGDRGAASIDLLWIVPLGR